MKRRTCPQCELRFKSRPRRLAEARNLAVICPKCGYISEVEDE
jgi:RNase P subunit RPR2